jgi:hypothetical protein
MSDNLLSALPSSDELGRGAIELLERHFAAINAGDREAFRETAYLFDANDGLPFERWWTGMRSLAPLSVALKLSNIDRAIKEGMDRHVASWVQVVATSATTGLTYSDEFVVWYLLGSGRWKLGCRIHWWLSAARSQHSDQPLGATVLSSEETATLLSNLCARLGFCLPPSAQEQLAAAPSDVEGFTAAVFIAEGLDPSIADRRLYKQVREMVAAAFRRNEDREGSESPASSSRSTG